jgi:sulfate permease, SulP family
MTGTKGVRNVVCDLSASSVMDLAGARMLAELYENLANRGIGLTVTNAHGARARHSACRGVR